MCTLTSFCFVRLFQMTELVNKIIQNKVNNY